MNFLKTVEFEMTQAQFEKWWLYLRKEYGSELVSLNLFPYGSPPPNPDEKKRYSAGVPEHYELNAPQELLDLVVKR